MNNYERFDAFMSGRGIIDLGRGWDTRYSYRNLWEDGSTAMKQTGLNFNISPLNHNISNKDSLVRSTFCRGEVEKFVSLALRYGETDENDPPALFQEMLGKYSAGVGRLPNYYPAIIRPAQAYVLPNKTCVYIPMRFRMDPSLSMIREKSDDYDHQYVYTGTSGGRNHTYYKTKDKDGLQDSCNMKQNTRLDKVTPDWIASSSARQMNVYVRARPTDDPTIMVLRYPGFYARNRLINRYCKLKGNNFRADAMYNLNENVGVLGTAAFCGSDGSFLSAKDEFFLPSGCCRDAIPQAIHKTFVISFSVLEDFFYKRDYTPTIEGPFTGLIACDSGNRSIMHSQHVVWNSGYSINNLTKKELTRRGICSNLGKFHIWYEFEQTDDRTWGNNICLCIAHFGDSKVQSLKEPHIL